MTSFARHSVEEIAESVDYGVTASAAELEVGPKFLRITDIQGNNVNWDTVPWCECGEGERQEARLRSGDIVFARTGATTGKSFLIRECPADAVFASYLIRVRVKDNVEPSYVSHFFQTEDYWAQITKGARGAAQPGVNATTLKALRFLCPPSPNNAASPPSSTVPMPSEPSAGKPWRNSTCSRSRFSSRCLVTR